MRCNIDFMESEDIKAMIEKGLPGSLVNVRGDGVHFEAVVVSPEFEGKGLLLRHQIVYKALGEAMKEQIHALSIKAYTPQQWDKVRGS